MLINYLTMQYNLYKYDCEHEYNDIDESSPINSYVNHN